MISHYIELGSMDIKSSVYQRFSRKKMHEKKSHPKNGSTQNGHSANKVGYSISTQASSKSSSETWLLLLSSSYGLTHEAMWTYLLLYFDELP